MSYNAHLVVRSAIAHMQAAPARPLTSVAAQCGVSRHTLARAFLRGGTAPVALVRRLCLRRKIETLMTSIPPKSIKEISDGLGFATPRSFARWLKREDGVAPRALRDALCRRLELEQSQARDDSVPPPAFYDTPPGTPLVEGGDVGPIRGRPRAPRGARGDV